jgi:hypothetical protein
VGDFNSWDVIFGEGSSQVILCFDFPMVEYREASFAELVGRMRPDYEFLRARPLVGRPNRQLSGDSYIGPWIEDIELDRRPVRAVFGHRVGGVYAAAIADELSHGNQAPRTILFDPQLPTVKFLAQELRKDIVANSSLLSDDEIERVGKIATHVSGMAVGDITEAASVMVDDYLSIISVAFERAGLGQIGTGNLTAPFESYMSWISLADKIDLSWSWEHSTVISSVDNPGQFGRGIRSDAREAELLRSDSVARMIVNLLGSQ